MIGEFFHIQLRQTTATLLIIFSRIVTWVFIPTVVLIL